MTILANGVTEFLKMYQSALVSGYEMVEVQLIL